MSELEKILEEIESYKKAAYENKNFDGLTAFRICQDIIRKHMNNGWIPVKERLPEDDKYILLSFENFSLPMVGRYDGDAEGGAFYLGDCGEEDTCISMDLLVNAWMPLPEPYRPETAI